MNYGLKFKNGLHPEIGCNLVRTFRNTMLTIDLVLNDNYFNYTVDVNIKMMALRFKQLTIDDTTKYTKGKNNRKKIAAAESK